MARRVSLATASSFLLLLVLLSGQQYWCRQVDEKDTLALASNVSRPAAPTQTHGSTRTSIESPSEERSLSNQRNKFTQYQTDPYQPDTRIPLWSIAHMINSVAQVDLALSQGANAIESDVSFDELGTPVETFHGFPCDCGRHCDFRNDFSQFVRALATRTGPNSAHNLQLILFDLKLSKLTSSAQKSHAGRELARILHELLYERHLTRARGRPHDRNRPAAGLTKPAPRVIISINHVHDVELVKAFLAYLKQNRLDLMQRHVGFDVGMNDDLKEVEQMWNSLEGATRNIWQGDGLTNCANLFRGHQRLTDAIRIRNEQGPFRKVYFWTVDILYHIRTVLRLGADALLTNQPQRVLQVLAEKEFSQKYRLASHYDDPFAQYWIQPAPSGASIPSLSEAIETLSNIRNTSANFIRTLPNGLAATIKKVAG